MRAVPWLRLPGLLPNWPPKAKCSCGQGTRPPTKAISPEEVPNIRPCLETPCFVQQGFTEHLLYLEVGTEAVGDRLEIRFEGDRVE